MVVLPDDVDQCVFAVASQSRPILVVFEHVLFVVAELQHVFALLSLFQDCLAGVAFYFVYDGPARVDLCG